mmetsp:Transcript_40386/g.66339  ORF Transcript_40386/g.66339 Transcript_40386/m.66339 type:complete len:205 (+) Transcript_40386:100-714(+)
MKKLFNLTFIRVDVTQCVLIVCFSGLSHPHHFVGAIIVKLGDKLIVVAIAIAGIAIAMFSSNNIFAAHNLLLNVVCLRINVAQVRVHHFVQRRTARGLCTRNRRNLSLVRIDLCQQTRLCLAQHIAHTIEMLVNTAFECRQFASAYALIRVHTLLVFEFLRVALVTQQFALILHARHHMLVSFELTHCFCLFTRHLQNERVTRT